MISSGDAQIADVKPVLQVVDLRLVNPQTQNTANERYRIMLSDGEFLQQGMLATQRNDLVRSEQLQKGSIVRVTQFVRNVIQSRVIIIILELDVILDKCEPIGTPRHISLNPNGNSPSMARPPPQAQQPTTVHPSMNLQSSFMTGNPQSFSSPGGATGFDGKPNAHFERNGHIGHGSSISHADSGRYNPPNASFYSKPDSGAAIYKGPANTYLSPPQQSYQQPPPPMYSNRGPIAKNEAPPRIIPIAALNPYQSRWTIKARVTAKGDLRHYNNARGDGKVFSFDLLDSEGGEIKVTCFNAVADQFYPLIEPNKVYLISKGTVKVIPERSKPFNTLPNDHEIHLESTSVVQPFLEDDKSIPQQQFHFRSISDIEEMDNNSILDVIGIVFSVSPSSSIMRKNGTEVLKRALQLKDMSGRSIELTMWGNFCNAEGQTLQNMCDSGMFPVLAVKAGRVNDFNGKALGTISSSQLFIEPDFPEAHRIREWFERDGKSAPTISISRESTVGRTDVRKTISQIKDEKLGTSEKPDWITISATPSFIRPENFCYTACPIKTGDRQCSKKVTNNGDGKWLCEKCDQIVDECDYRYILQFQIQDHTGLTWVTAFQESGEEMIGVSAKDLYLIKYEEQDDDRFQEIMRSVLFKKYIFKLKVKEEMFGDEIRVKSTAVKVEKVNLQTETKYVLDLIDKFNVSGESNSLAPNAGNAVSNSAGMNNVGFGSGFRESASNVMNYGGSLTSRVQPADQTSPYGNKYGGSRLTQSPSVYCSGCGGAGHTPANCPKFTRDQQGQGYGGGSFSSQMTSGASGSGSDNCFKCGEAGHWSRNCPSTNAPPAYGSNTNVPPAYGSNMSSNPGRFGNVPRQQVGGF
ncbi:unnamed protein product [Cuscuta campestris]|uniref:Replication protein A subunit n=1 Tax=Cuscuta campestris TaxID=132261 RepID=A0A484KKB3_9ASTE|nr:unnamed protein product [Cuscuta campestris]